MTDAQRAKRILPCALLLSCVVTTVGVLFSCGISAAQIINIEADGIAWPQTDYIRLAVVGICRVFLDLTMLASFLFFTRRIVHRRAVFGKSQTVCLLLIAVSLLLRGLIGLALPSVQSDNPMIGFMAPTLDLRLLSFSAMFFAFAGIFEYGRILQEDSDNIL